ncbi:MAG: rod shape-determining protein MreD [Candidatus Eisenbacteria bacterium]
MRRFSLWLLVVLALIFQVTIFRKIELWGMRPDATVIILVYMGLGLGSVPGALFGFLLGLANLSILSSSMASMPLAGTVVGFVAGRYWTKVMYESYLVQLVIIFVSVLVFDAVNLAWVDPSSLPLSLLRFSLGSAAYTSVAGVILAVVIERVIGLRLVSQR